ncbi:1,2-dihydroxy-3-keto-5-methylthiopentene dioxygenase [Piscirickettsia salmonis]|uniref:1,2-dihydroxy-3-keto-5-methylthiopentene dioxygenase n=1 Tax=Piscirickettsia salmonis TaxID=1238 RepID=UPI000F080A8E|nr:acireductone dioxygenase [Piscirickettsiaceae bacterium NZ-RLO2]
MSQLTIFHANNSHQMIFQSSNQREISSQLAHVGIRFEQWQAHAKVRAEDSEEHILTIYAEDIHRLKKQGGYQAVDVISLDSSHPDKALLRQKFLSEHTHSEDEVRFFVKGKGLFCLHIDDKVYQVLCEQNDLISVPDHVAHWFDMGSEPEFTAIRLFNNTEGWVAELTGSNIAKRFPLLD